MLWFTGAYIVIALCISLFYGRYAGEIWVINWKDYKPIQRVHQRLFNFLGAIYGFVILYYLLYKLSLNDFKIMNLVDLVLLIIAILGTMGLLPAHYGNFGTKY